MLKNNTIHHLLKMLRNLLRRKVSSPIHLLYDKKFKMEWIQTGDLTL